MYQSNATSTIKVSIGVKVKFHFSRSKPVYSFVYSRLTFIVEMWLSHMKAQFSVCKLFKFQD